MWMKEKKNDEGRGGDFKVFFVGIDKGDWWIGERVIFWAFLDEIYLFLEGSGCDEEDLLGLKTIYESVKEVVFLGSFPVVVPGSFCVWKEEIFWKQKEERERHDENEGNVLFWGD